ncbi:RNA-binding protein 44 isoform X2 [Nothobranchius furzeri]|nr:RNA-binding protein 44 [Nothobranchius furzeri]
MAGFQSGWPGRPGTVFYEEPVSIPGYILDVAGPPPRLYYVERRRAMEPRKFLLQKSLFELVVSRHVVRLTDPDLLQWYFSLSLEDKKIIQDEGGFPQFLQGHPALDLYQDHASVKGMPHSQPLEVLPNNARESSAPFVCVNNRSKPQQLGEEICHNPPVVNRPTYYHPLNQSQPKMNCAAVDRLPLNMELERHSQVQNPELWNLNWMPPIQSVAFTDPGVSPSQTAWPAVRPTPEQHHDGSMLRSLGTTSPSQPVQPQKVHCREGDAVCGNIAADKDKACKLGLKDQSDKLHTIMEMDEGILMCLPRVGTSTHDAAVQCSLVCVNQHTQAPTSGAEENTDRVGFTSAHTQTEAPEKAEQLVNTEVRMSDMDYFAKEFIKLKISQECKKPKEKIKRTSQEPPLRHETAEKAGCPADGGRNSHLMRQNEAEALKEEKDKSRRTAAVSPNTGGVGQSKKPEEHIKSKKVNIDKVWYDAEEYLQPSEPAEAAEVTMSPGETDESVRDEGSSSELWASYLPSDMTQHLSGAARDCSAALDGSTISPTASGAQTSWGDSSSTETKLLAELHLSASIGRKTLVSVTPTAEGTFLPQHFGTMSSLDTLMAELAQLHPHVDRQRIMDALMELKATLGRVMITLPLRNIRDMTSDLLNKPPVPHAHKEDPQSFC